MNIPVIIMCSQSSFKSCIRRPLHCCTFFVAMEKDLTVEHRGLKCSHKLNVPGREEREEEEVLKKGERKGGGQARTCHSSKERAGVPVESLRESVEAENFSTGYINIKIKLCASFMKHDCPSIVSCCCVSTTTSSHCTGATYPPSRRKPSRGARQCQCERACVRKQQQSSVGGQRGSNQHTHNKTVHTRNKLEKQLGNLQDHKLLFT